jgi:hypothetical protein
MEYGRTDKPFQGGFGVIHGFTHKTQFLFPLPPVPGLARSNGIENGFFS